jgi:hypothetical protein
MPFVQTNLTSRIVEKEVAAGLDTEIFSIKPNFKKLF